MVQERKARRWGKRPIPGPFLDTDREDSSWLVKAARNVHPELTQCMLRGAVHVEGLFRDTEVHRALYHELHACQRLPWSRHQIIEQRGPAVCYVLSKLQDRFGVTRVIDTRVNVYEKNDWKPRHQDRNAHCENAGNVTCGASFFSEGSLAFAPVEPEGSEDAFVFRQKPGDVFAFDNEVNRKFVHSVLPQEREVSFRVSIVLWGEREGSPLCQCSGWTTNTRT